MKELPVLCLAILAIIFIHATQRSEQKIPENKKKPTNQPSKDYKLTRPQLTQPIVHFASQSSNIIAPVGIQSLKTKPANNIFNEENDRIIVSKDNSDVLHTSSGRYYDPEFLLFQSRLKHTYQKVMAAK